MRIHPRGCDASDITQVLEQASWALRSGGLLIVTVPIGPPSAEGAVGPADVRGILARAHDLGFVLVGDLDGDVTARMREAAARAPGRRRGIRPRPADPEAPLMTRRRVLTIARVAIAVIVLAAVVWAVAKNWTEVSAHLDKISWPVFALSSLAAAVGTWLTMLGWRVILRDLGSDLHLAPSSGVYFVGQLGKYLPGSLWSVLVQADIASHLKVPRRRTAVTGLLALGLSLLTGLLVGLPATSFLLRRDSDAFSWWVLLAIPLVVVLCCAAPAQRDHRPHAAHAAARAARARPLRPGRADLGRHLRAGLARVRRAHAAAGAGRRGRRPAPGPDARGDDGLRALRLARHADRSSCPPASGRGRAC